ncbi:MAG: AraC family transcriptional regulator [Spirochaetota bacterium]
MAVADDTSLSMHFPLFYTYGNELIFVLNCAFARETKGRTVSLHTHPFHECIVVADGRLRYRIAGTSMHAGPADAILIAPGQTHTRTALGNTSFFGFHLMLHQDPRRPIQSREFPGQRALLAACRSIAAEAASQGHEWESIARHTMIAGLLRFSRTLYGAVPPVEKRSIDPAFINAVRYINDAIRTDISISDTAKAAGVSERHLTRLFRKHCGVAPVQYVLEKKLSLAYSDLISDKRSTVRAIAQRLGFYDAGYFAKMIKRAFGMSPTEIQSLEG